ncbi:PREDICTED: uncharacterized protein LOC109226066 [Nicotiana attenuata]|uniref:uncharacterized protein LOC109226066 n=1 Tax=Nicotiana attenuata TaxID=49451 RepID=UPI0009048F47|nr:PREDICTED: uncharacterized protein LOC109226066 [Nicotiana attenuata]
MVTVRTVIAVAASKGWPLFQMDVNNAFLQGDLCEKVYMQLPQGFHSQGESKVCRLLKSLYGLKQASRQWNINLTHTLLQAGFTQSPYDHSLFTKRDKVDIVIVLVYVDDLLISGSNSSLIQEAKETLHRNFKMKDLGELRYFLGIEVMRSNKGILFNQRKYAFQLISEVGLSACKPVSTPMKQNHKLTTVEYDKHAGNVNDAELQEAGSYQKLIGKLLYLTTTRPDISFVVQVLSQFMQHPKEPHMEAALRVVKYVKGRPGLGILLKGEATDELTAYCDSDRAACPNTRRSSEEAEYRSMAAAVAELIWMKGLLEELGNKVKEPIHLHCDSKPALQIAANPIFHERTKST